MTRYAIYFKPDPGHALSVFGASVIGYDPDNGADCPLHPALGAIAGWREMTDEPRRYGFHATLKAPFRLNAACDEADLIAACDAFARTRQGAGEISLSVGEIGNFIALKPEQPSEALAALAADCVRFFDRFRAPLSAEERARRKPHLLTARQREQLERYGYPYVLEDFRFHMTLTGPLPDVARAEVLPILRALYAPQQRPVLIDSIAIFRQATPAERFIVIHRAALRPGPADISR